MTFVMRVLMIALRFVDIGRRFHLRRRVNDRACPSGRFGEADVLFGQVFEKPVGRLLHKREGYVFQKGRRDILLVIYVAG